MTGMSGIKATTFPIADQLVWRHRGQVFEGFGDIIGGDATFGVDERENC